MKQVHYKTLQNRNLIVLRTWANLILGMDFFQTCIKERCTLIWNCKDRMRLRNKRWWLSVCTTCWTKAITIWNFIPKVYKICLNVFIYSICIFMQMAYNIICIIYIYTEMFITEHFGIFGWFLFFFFLLKIYFFICTITMQHK